MGAAAGEAAAAPSYAALFGRRYRALMVAALGATFLGSLDALMVTTALPTAAQDIGGVDLIALTVGATLVTITMTLPVAGAVIDRYGAGRSFAIACAVFSVANVIGGLAPTMEVVAASRDILGLGAGFMFAVPLGLFALYVPDELRPRAFGLNAAMWGVSAVIGPALGAGLTGTVGWRGVFWVNLPLIAVVAWCGLAAMRRHPDREQAGSEAPLNAIGPLLLGLVVLALLLEPAVAVVPALLFLLHERRTASPVFTHRPSSLAASAVSLASGAAFIGAEVYLPLELQAGFGHGVAVVGTALLLSTLGWTLGSTMTARLHVSPRRQVVSGTILVFVGTACMALPLGGFVLPMAAYAVSGVGMGICSPPLFTLVLAEVRAGREGQATSSIPVARQVGAGIGTALAGMAFAAVLSDHAARAAEHAGAHVPQVVQGARLSFVVVALIGLLGVLATRWLAERAEAGGAAAGEAERFAA